jgi:enoyl-CoA hydratase/carnithine racemase
MAGGAVEVDRRDHVAWVTLNRPPLNLFEPTLIHELRAAFEALAADASVRVAVLTGSGRAFTAGMDVHVLRDLGVLSARSLIRSLESAIAAVHGAPFPVVAAINGAALGAGFELALACDLRLASGGALLGLPEVRVGVPSVIQAALLPAAIGPARAAELLFSGEPITAERAAEWGLVNRTVPAADLRGAVETVVDTILASAPAAIRLQKELVIRWRSTDLATAIQYGVNAFAAAYASGEPQEGAAAFLDKRPPRWGTV